MGKKAVIVVSLVDASAEKPNEEVERGYHGGALKGASKDPMDEGS